MKKALFAAIAAVSSLFSAEDISGFWKTLNEDTGNPECVIGVYEYKGLYYGRIIGSYSGEGILNDTIYAPSTRAPGVLGEPYYSGLDIIWYLQDVGSKFKGKILDPQKGNIYNSELWIDNGNLVVRGKLFVFGKSYTWYPAAKADFPEGFKLPDLKKFVPAIPEVN